MFRKYHLKADCEFMVDGNGTIDDAMRVLSAYFARTDLESAHPIVSGEIEVAPVLDKVNL